ncbi:MAG: hypothetical protein HOH95_03960 [Dehalococcoidia bacterium]|jgi:hypothetical protein|nr:hypothetical protein [Dehalococcoidia bacterium]
MTEDQSLVGAWRLVSYEAQSPEGVEVFPFGVGATGMIIWDADGSFSAQISPGSSSGDREPSYIAYFGRWELDEGGRAVLHHVAGSVTAALRDTTQRRELAFDSDGKRVTLTPPARDGAVAMSLVWERER